LIAGSFAIGRPLTVSRLPGATSADASRDSGMIVIRAMLQHLLDGPAKLTALLPLHRRQQLIRTLLRRCLLAGVPVDYRRASQVLGWSRVLKDRVRARVWFLRTGLVQGIRDGSGRPRPKGFQSGKS
jgi:hypothetical protein